MFKRSLISAVIATGLTLGGALAASAQDRTKVTVSMHFNVPQLSWYGFYWAEEKGYFEEAGIDVDFQYLRGSALAVQATGAGQSDIGVAGADTIISGVEKDLPVIAIANHLQKDATGVIVRRESGEPASFADLAGLRIITSDTTTLASLLRAALKRAGVSDKVDVQSVDAQTVCTLVIAGQADGCTGFSFAQALQVKQQGVDATFLPYNSDDFPILGHSILANTDWLEGNGDAARAFLAAVARGYTEASADLPATVEMMKRVAPTLPVETIDEAAALVAATTTSPRSEEFGWGYMTVDAWKNLYEGLMEGGAFQPGLDPATIFTNEYLPGK